MPESTLQDLTRLGQSIWIDYISRPLMQTGKLQKLIDLGLRGMTSNPTIFNQSISSSHDYDEDIVRLGEAGKSNFEIYDELTIKDIQDATDIFRPVYEKTKALDGYVSLEINPKLAMDTQASVKEGIRLFKKVNRPNVMIKVPSTSAGFPVIEELLAQGINVNVTLIFSREQYVNTVHAYFKGMSRLAQKTKDLSKTRSVASIFVSRVDTFVDQMLSEKAAKENDPVAKERLKSLLGKAAVANSALIFAKFKELFAGQEFGSLAKKRANEQRVLWASTGTKNPQYSDIKYVTELISKPTVNTLPEKTIEAFLDHGSAKEALRGHTQEAEEVIEALKSFGIDIDRICAQLLVDGVTAFEKSFDELLQSLEAKTRSLCVK